MARNLFCDMEMDLSAIVIKCLNELALAVSTNEKMRVHKINKSNKQIIS